jgi:hypothetical protein
MLIWFEFTSKHSDLENLKTTIIRKQQEREEEEKEEQDTDSVTIFSSLFASLPCDNNASN